MMIAIVDGQGGEIGRKILIPSNKCNVEVVASSQNSLSVQVETLIDRVKEIIQA